MVYVVFDSIGEEMSVEVFLDGLICANVLTIDVDVWISWMEMVWF